METTLIAQRPTPVALVSIEKVKGAYCDICKKIKGAHTVSFNISFYYVNQKPMSPRTNFHCETTRSACSLLGGIQQHIYVLYDSLLNYQMARTLIQ